MWSFLPGSHFRGVTWLRESCWASTKVGFLRVLPHPIAAAVQASEVGLLSPNDPMKGQWHWLIYFIGGGLPPTAPSTLVRMQTTCPRMLFFSTGKPCLFTHSYTGKPSLFTHSYTGKPSLFTHSYTGNPVYSHTATQGNPVYSHSYTGKPSLFTHSWALHVRVIPLSATCGHTGQGCLPWLRKKKKRSVREVVDLA